MADQFERLKRALAGRYDLERVIGTGGMATVYLAEDVRHHRKVAVKVLRAEVAAVLGAERFLAEIEVTANLQHPHILPLFDSGEADHFLYYVMPFVEEETLRHRVRREGQLDVAEAVRVIADVAAGLDYAHRHDVLHRDIKPENILMHEGHVMLADFGVARAISVCCEERTEAGIAVGTPAYMSPEQAAADDTLDGRSDLYSLACVAFELLTGQPPFVGTGPQKVMARHATEMAPPVRALRPTVPQGVDDVVSRALAKSPADRHPTAEAFRDALLAGLKGPRVPARIPGRASIAVLPFANASAEPDTEYFSDGVTDELINALVKIDGLQVASRTSVFALKDARKDVRSIGALLGVAAVLEGTVRQAGKRLRVTVQLTDTADGHHLWSERFDRELEDVFAVQDEITHHIVSTLRRTLLPDIGDPTPTRYTESVAAYSLYLKGRYEWNRRTPESMASAARYFEEALQEDPAFALAYSGLADAYALQVDYRNLPVDQVMDRARTEALRALELDERLAEAHTSLAWVRFVYDWDWAAAGRHFARAVELNPSYATARQWYSWFLAAMGRIDDGLEQATMALELDPISHSIRRALGWLYYYARRSDEAVHHVRHALRMDPTAEETYRVLGLVHTQRKDYDEARAALREALAIRPESTASFACLGYLEAQLGSESEARRILTELLELSQASYVSPVGLTMVYAGLGEKEGAFEQLERAYANRRGWLAYLRVEPVLDSLRNDPRFADLLERMALGP